MRLPFKQYACLAIFLAAAILSCSSQTLSVRKFDEMPFDVTARSEPRKDYNDRLCALLRIMLPVENCKFEGNVVASEFDVNEYKVYLTEGSQQIRIKCPGNESLDLVFGNVSDIKSLKSGVVYKVELSGYKIPEALMNQADPGANFVVLNVSPADAQGLTVMIGGVQRAVTNGVAQEYLPYGEYEYEVNAVGYSPQNGRLRVARGETSTLNVSLKSMMATLVVSTDDKSAHITVNGQPKGTGKWSGQLPPGMYRVEVTAVGCKPYVETVVLAERDNREVSVPALSPITGALSVAYTPTGANINIDGKSQGQTPKVLYEMPIGIHKVIIDKDGYETLTLNVNIKEGETTVIQGSLKGSEQTAEVSQTTVETPPAGNMVAGKVNGHEYVDLGLPSGTLWASLNIGAYNDSWESTGGQFAWGDTAVCDPFKNASSNLSKYIQFLTPVTIQSIEENQRKANLNRKKRLEKKIKDISGLPQYDAATAQWGEPWCIPGYEQAKELQENCTVEKIANGYKVTGPNGNSIYFDGGKIRLSTLTSLRDNHKFHKDHTDILYFNKGSDQQIYIDLAWDSAEYWDVGIRPVIKTQKTSE